jgi:potassium-transporting ATPase potassium-binding subunit
MVGRTPEYLGKRVGTAPIKWAAAILILHPLLILVPTAVAVLGGFVTPLPAPGVIPTAHTFTVVLYEFTSEAANNGSGMGTINDNTPFFNLVGALVMLVGRYVPFVGMLIIGGLFARQDILPPGPGTMRTSSVTFTIFLIGIVIIVTGLLFLPVIALGPLSQIGG